MSAAPAPGEILLAPVEGAALSDRLQQASARGSFLSQVARRLSATMHPDRAVDLVLESLVGTVVDWAQVALVEGRQLAFRARETTGRTRHGTLDSVDSGSSLGRVLESGVSDLIMVADGDDATSQTLSSAVPMHELRESVSRIAPVDMLTIALTARGTTYGAMTIARRGGLGFDDEAIAFLEELAHRVSVTLDATRALGESRRVASVLSRHLNPPVVPSYDGVEFASYYRVAFEHEALGGDFYDVHGDHDEWTAVMGDVCGKGVEAAVLTGKVRQTVRTAAVTDRDPARTLELTNRVLIMESSDTFVTCICARGRRRGDHLLVDVATAGHPTPLVVRSDGSVEEVPVRGPVLGLVETSTYSSRTVDLAPGETLVFYTDGVSEAPGHRERFGEDKLRRVLADTGAAHVRAQVESLAVAVSSHLSDRRHDDIAIFALQANG